MAIAAALGSNLSVKTILAFASGGRRFLIGFVAGMAMPTVLFAIAITLAVKVL